MGRLGSWTVRSMGRWCGGLPAILIVCRCRCCCHCCCCRGRGSINQSVGRVGEKVIQGIGLAAPSNDANTGDIEHQWNSFALMRDGLKDIQAQVSRVQTQVLAVMRPLYVVGSFFFGLHGVVQHGRHNPPILLAGLACWFAYVTGSFRTHGPLSGVSVSLPRPNLRDPRRLVGTIARTNSHPPTSQTTTTNAM